jgi:hypothetical protein
MTGGPFTPNDEIGAPPRQHRTANEESGPARAASKSTVLSTTIFRATANEKSGQFDLPASAQSSGEMPS